MDSHQRLIVIGASTGGREALKEILSILPAELPIAVLVVMHIGGHISLLPQLLAKHTRLNVRHPVNGETINVGDVLVAPPDYHLLIDSSGKVRLSHGPKENHSRPAIDPLFRSAALYYQNKTIGVVLTGELDDGTVGLQAVKTYGGTTIVQDPADAEAPSMPTSALRYTDPDYCLPLAEIGPTLVNLTRRPLKPVAHPTSSWVELENKFSLGEVDVMEKLEEIARPSTYTCPECQGTLWEIHENNYLKFRCHTGHTFSPLALAFAQDYAAEEAIWAAVRALQEKEGLQKSLAEHARINQRPEAAVEHQAVADGASQHAAVLRNLIKYGQTR